MHRKAIPDVYEIPRPKPGKTLAWLTVFSVMAIVIGATLALVTA